jgi:hypothetical protein
VRGLASFPTHSRKQATIVALAPEDDRLPSRRVPVGGGGGRGPSPEARGTATADQHRRRRALITDRRSACVEALADPRRRRDGRWGAAPRPSCARSRAPARGLPRPWGCGDEALRDRDVIRRLPVWSPPASHAGAPRPRRNFPPGRRGPRSARANASSAARGTGTRSLWALHSGAPAAIRRSGVSCAACPH